MSRQERPTREEVAQRTIERLKRFWKRLESGEPFQANQVTVEDTPDGTLTTRKRVEIVPSDIPRTPDGNYVERW